MGFLGIESESRKNHTAHLRIIQVLVISSLLLVVRLLVLDQITLQRRHLGLVEERGFGAAPQVPHVIERHLLTLGPVATEIGLPGQAVQFVQQTPSGIGFSVHDDCFELPFVGHRNRSVVHQVRIDDQVHTTLRKEQPDMFL